MNFKKLSILAIVLLIADQALKIWVKTHMLLDESIIVFPDWFQLRFIENNGAAFGMHIATSGGFDWGKLLLGLFRIGLVGFLVWLIRSMMLNKEKKDADGSHRRTHAYSGRCTGQHLGQRILRIDFLGIDALRSGALRRTLRRIHDGEGRGYVLFSVIPME